MRTVVALLGCALLFACAGGNRGADAGFSGEASRMAEQQARERCAAEGRRPQLVNVFENSDGSRRYEYRCVQ